MTPNTAASSKWKFFDFGPVTGKISKWRIILGSVMTVQASTADNWSENTLYAGFAILLLAESIYYWKGGYVWRKIAIAGGVLALIGIGWEFGPGFWAGISGAPHR